MEKFAELLRAVLEALKIDAIVNDELPEGLSEKVLGKMAKYQDAEQRYNELAESVQNIGKSLKAENEDDLTVAQTIERLPDVLALAEQGKRLVEFKIREAVEWFGKAKFDAQRKEFSDVEKRQVARIEKITDLDHLEDLISEYKELAEAKFSNARKTSANPTLPEDKGSFAYAGGARDIKESSSRLFKHGKKEEK